MTQGPCPRTQQPNHPVTKNVNTTSLLSILRESSINLHINRQSLHFGLLIRKEYRNQPLNSSISDNDSPLRLRINTGPFSLRQQRMITTPATTKKLCNVSSFRYVQLDIHYRFCVIGIEGYENCGRVSTSSGHNISALHIRC